MRYQIGGTLAPNDPTYVEREADKELYQALKKGDFCYILNSRQMGKSSLMVKTKHRLQEVRFAIAIALLHWVGKKLLAVSF